MGVIVNKEQEENTELSRRISADLRARSAEVSQEGERDGVDLAEDAEYPKNLKKTGRFGWVWIVLIVLALMSLVSIVLL
jgi:hypothetical protein